MLLDRYWDTINDLYSRVKTTQRENIIAAGKLIADAWIRARACTFAIPATSSIPS